MSESLFKFFPYNAHDLDAIANNFLWFSHYSQFNDPFEDVFIKNAFDYNQQEFNEITAINFFKDLHKGHIPLTQVEQSILDMKLKGTFEDEYNNLISVIFSGAKKRFEDFVGNSKACCFARNNEYGEVLKNRLMWSHYADGLRGFCIEFNKKMLIKGISENLGEEIFFSEMKYGQLKKFSFEELSTNSARNINSGTKDFAVGDIASLKSKEWAYESEFRLMTELCSEVKIPIESIVSITVGAKMSQTKLTTLKSILKGIPKLRCSLYEAYIDNDTFEIEKKHIYEIQ
jgi:hypothetical protein